MTTAAYISKVYLSGSKVSFTDLPTTKDNNNYQITDSTKRVLTDDIVVKVDNIIFTSGFSINHMFGIISFLSTQSGNVTISGNYLPLNELTSCKSYNFDSETTILENTVLGGGDFKTNVLGLIKCNISLSNFYNTDKDLTQYLTNKSKVVIELDNNVRILRGLFIFSKESIKSPVDQLLMDYIDLTLSESKYTKISINGK